MGEILYFAINTSNCSFWFQFRHRLFFLPRIFSRNIRAIGKITSHQIESIIHRHIRQYLLSMKTHEKFLKYLFRFARYTLWRKSHASTVSWLKDSLWHNAKCQCRGRTEEPRNHLRQLLKNDPIVTTAFHRPFPLPSSSSYPHDW